MSQVTILKSGLITKIYRNCNDIEPTVGQFIDRADCYDFETILSERTGEKHGSVVAIAGRHLIERTKDGRYTVWYVTSDNAEPWSTYKTYDAALEELKREEKV